MYKIVDPDDFLSNNNTTNYITNKTTLTFSMVSRDTFLASSRCRTRISDSSLAIRAFLALMFSCDVSDSPLCVDLLLLLRFRIMDVCVTVYLSNKKRQKAKKPPFCRALKASAHRSDLYRKTHTPKRNIQGSVVFFVLSRIQKNQSKWCCLVN